MSEYMHQYHNRAGERLLDYCDGCEDWREKPTGARRTAVHVGDHAPVDAPEFCDGCGHCFALELTAAGEAEAARITGGGEHRMIAEAVRNTYG